MNQKLKIFLPLLVLAAGVAVAAAIVRARPDVERRTDAVPPPLVRALTVHVEDIPLEIVSQGTVEPLTESTLVAQVAGQVTYVSPRFAEGGFFRRGQTLLRIDPRDYELRVSQSDAQVAQARVALEREEAESALARQEWRELGRGEPTSLTLREPQLAQARAALQGAEAALEQARLDLSRTAVQAPFDGRIRQKQVDVGQFVGVGSAVATVFSTDYAEIRLPVAESELGFLEIDLGRTWRESEGPDVRLSATLAGEPASWRGRIVRTDSEFDRQTRMLDVFARVRDPFGLRESGGSPLPMGLFVDARIAGRTATQVVRLPRQAIRSGSRVLIVEDGRLRHRDVEVLRLSGDDAIVSSGLEEGEQVCISVLETVVDGMSVRVQLEPEPVRLESGAEARS